MRVLLVHANRCRDLLPPPPIGVSAVASAAADAGHRVRLLDYLVTPRPEDVLRRILGDFQPDVIGFSIRNLDNLVKQRTRVQLLPLARELAALRDITHAPLVVGGAAVTILGPATLDALPADYAIVGEGETSFVALLEAIAGKQPLTTVHGLAYRSNGRIISNPVTHHGVLAASGMERWVEWNRYERIGSTWAIQTKRGCPLPCIYCSYGSIEGRGTRLRPADDVAEEIARVARTVKPRTFEFVDSTFNVPLEHALAVCDAIEKRRVKTSFTTASINPLTASGELFHAMERVGFNSIMVTPEAASDRTLAALRKGFTTEHVYRTRDAARASSMASLWFFMLGGPGETEQTADETVSFAERALDWDRCMTVMMTGIRILPGTDLARLAVEQGIIRADQDFAEPVYYFSPDVSEDWVLQRINRAVGHRPTIVHAGEESNRVQRVIGALSYYLRVPPPHWRFLPDALRAFPLRQLRRWRPDIGSRPANRA